TVAGLVERPDASTVGPRRVHLFVGGRPFRDRELVLAAERAYRTTVPHGARPSLLLYLEVPPGGVDVNVHPAKAEVRFRDRAEILAMVEEAVRAALRSLESAATLDARPSLPQLQRPIPSGAATGGRAGTPGGRAAPARRAEEADQLAFFVPIEVPAVEGRAVAPGAGGDGRGGVGPEAGRPSGRSTTPTSSPRPGAGSSSSISTPPTSASSSRR